MKSNKITVQIIWLIAFALNSMIAFGQTLDTKFDTKNNVKAKGIWMTVRYPSDFTARDGDRPNIVQKFVGKTSGVYTQMMLQVKDVGVDATRECNALGTKDWEEAFTIKEQNTVASNAKLIKHEGQSGVILDTDTQAERAGILVKTKQKVMVVCYKESLISLYCGTANMQGDNMLLQKDMKALLPVCVQYFNSLVLMDKY